MPYATGMKREKYRNAICIDVFIKHEYSRNIGISMELSKELVLIIIEFF